MNIYTIIRPTGESVAALL